MSQRPRNVAQDRLVSLPLLSYSYMQSGMLEAGVCVFAWLTTFVLHDVPLAALPFSYETHWKVGADPIVGTGGTLIDANRQIYVATLAQSVYFATLVLSQVRRALFRSGCHSALRSFRCGTSGY